LDDAPRSKEGILYHNFDNPDLWADSMYMLPPFLAEAEEYDEAIRQLDGHWKVLFIEKIGLLAHIWNCEKNTFKRDVIWAEGNGWAIAAMAQIIDKLPQEREKQKQHLITRTRLLIDNCLKYKREDHYFHDALNDPSTVVENGLSQLLAYGIYRGVVSGWLDSTYIYHADAMFEAVENKVDNYGLVQDVCSAKDGFVTPIPNGEGQAWFIMLYAARERWQNLQATPSFSEPIQP
jgi:rhamnogalacturonyl hydrolase YesR